MSLWDAEDNQGKKSQFCLLGMHVCLVSAVEKGLMSITLNAANEVWSFEKMILCLAEIFLLPTINLVGPYQEYVANT